MDGICGSITSESIRRIFDADWSKVKLKNSMVQNTKSLR